MEKLVLGDSATKLGTCRASPNKSNFHRATCAYKFVTLLIQLNRLGSFFNNRSGNALIVQLIFFSSGFDILFVEFFLFFYLHSQKFFS